jgi:hypothetical protein
MFADFSPKQPVALVVAATFVLASMAATAAAPAPDSTAARAHTSIAGKRTKGGRHDDDVERRDLVVRAHSIVAGKSIGEWTAEHWQWTFSFLAGQSPVFDDQTGELGYLGDVGGPVFFLGGPDDARLGFDVPCGKYLLFALLTQAWTLEGDDTEASARAENEAFIGSITNLSARLDGKRIPDLFAHRETTPRLFPVTIPNGGLFGDEGGSFDAVADGYWLLLRPLAPGRHTLVFGGSTEDGQVDYRSQMKLNVTGRCRNR